MATIEKRGNSYRSVFRYAGIHYPKTSEKPPFQTMDEIKRKIQHGGLTDAEIEDL